MVTKRQGDGEAGAGAGTALRLDGPPQEFAELPTDRQAQARAPEAPGHRNVLLLEPSEQAFGMGRIKADPCILHSEAPVVSRASRGDAQNDRALMGEFDRVGQEVGEDLLQPHLIAEHRPLGQGMQIHAQSHALVLGPRAGQGGGGADGVGEVEGFVLHRDRAGLDLRKVQNVGQ